MLTTAAPSMLTASVTATTTMECSEQALQPRLPLELQDLTLQYLSYDHRALLRSSTVCKDWRNICATMLFASIDLSSKPGEKPGVRFKSFSELTRSPSPPKFLANIQHITMGGEAKPKHILETQVDRLGSLTSMSIVGKLRDNVPDTDCYGAISKRFTGLKHLDLAAAPFKKHSTLVGFLTSLPGLQNLTLGNMKWSINFDDPNIPVSPDTGPLPAIERLRVSLKTLEHVDRYLLAWLGTQLQARASLKFLEYTVLVASPPPVFSREFLQRISSTLERITLDFEMGALADDILRNPPCIYSCLTTMDLGFPIWEVQYGVRALDVMYPKRRPEPTLQPPLQLSSITRLSEALQHVSAPSLQDLTFRLYAEPDLEKNGKAFCSLGTLRSIDFSTLDQRLSPPNSPFPSLRDVNLICGDLLAPAPFIEFFFIQGAHHGATPYYSRSPQPRVADQFEDAAVAFSDSAFPLVMARQDVRLRVVKGERT